MPCQLKCWIMGFLPKLNSDYITPGIYPNGGLGKNTQIAIHAGSAAKPMSEDKGKITVY